MSGCDLFDVGAGRRDHRVGLLLAVERRHRSTVRIYVEALLQIAAAHAELATAEGARGDRDDAVVVPGSEVMGAAGMGTLLKGIDRAFNK